MPPRNPPPGQLDIPLVWETGPAAARGAVPAQDEPPVPSAPAAGALRLWAGALADAAAAAVGAAACVALSAIVLDGISPAQCAVAAAAGLEATTVVAVGCLWGWRATPGMLLMGVCFSQPIPFGRVCRMWCVWLPCLLLAGLPLVVRRRGESAAERLAGGLLSPRSLPAGA